MLLEFTGEFANGNANVVDRHSLEKVYNINDK